MKKLTYILVTILVSSLLVSGLVSAQENEMKTYTNEKFGFSISYPEDWNKEYSDENGELYPYLRLSSTVDPEAATTVSIIELASPTSLEELKRYRELHAQIYDESWNEIKIEEFAGLQAVTARYTIVGEKMTTGEDGYEKWEKSEWKVKWIGLISEGYLYRITTSAPQEGYEEVNEKYLSKILDSFRLENLQQ